jgi:hypothetical protein
MVAVGTRNARDLVGGETRQHLQGQRGLRLGREHRMAGSEHQPQYVVLDRLGQLKLVGPGQLAAEQLDLAGKRDVPADLVDRPALGHRGQRIVGAPSAGAGWRPGKLGRLIVLLGRRGLQPGPELALLWGQRFAEVVGRGELPDLDLPLLVRRRVRAALEPLDASSNEATSRIQ